MSHNSTTINTDGLRRGDAIQGGRFVGKALRSSVWVCYDAGELAFTRMCEAFDRLYGPPVIRVANAA